MKTRAALTWKAGAPLTIETVDLQGPRAGEVLVKVNATGICHTGHYTLKLDAGRRGHAVGSRVEKAHGIAIGATLTPSAK